MSRLIREGDYIVVRFTNDDAIFGHVLNMPVATGDLLYIREVSTKQIFGVNPGSASFKYVKLLEERELEF